MPVVSTRRSGSPKPLHWKGSRRRSAPSATPTTSVAESFIGLFKNEAVAAGSPFRAGPLRTLADVETITMNYVDWYNNHRLHSLLDNRTPEEHEQAYYAQPGSPSGDAANKKTA